MRRRTLWLCIATVAAACGGRVETLLGTVGDDVDAQGTGASPGAGDGTGSTGATADASGGGGATGGGGSTDASVLSIGSGGGGPDSTVPGLEGEPTCGGVSCAPGQACCLLDMRCFDPAAHPEACPVGALSPTAPAGAQPCSSNAHCPAGEYCASANDSMCAGPGYCWSTTNCPLSFNRLVCACNGVTYLNFQSACNDGTRWVGVGAGCGDATTPEQARDAGFLVTYCGQDSQCPTGQSCCALTGACYDPATPELCVMPPEGTRKPCLSDADCERIDEFCLGSSCGSPGGCAPASFFGDCTGVLAPVCGCDGKNYTSTACAAHSLVQVAHDGACQ